MIRYALNCAKGHAFESWFASSAAYDKQERQKLVTCPVCGTTKVRKTLMTPRLARGGKRVVDQEAAPPGAPASVEASASEAADGGTAPAPSAPASPVAMLSPPHEQEIRRKLRELRDHLVKSAENVGPRFAEEARKMHYQETEPRSIYGIASPDEAKALSEEGIEFSPLPILPDERN